MTKLHPIIEQLQTALAALDEAGELLAAIKIAEAIAILEASENPGSASDDDRSPEEN